MPAWQFVNFNRTASIMQKREITKYENLIVQFKKDYLSYRRMLNRKIKKHDYTISPFEYKKGVKIIYPVDDYKIPQIIGFALHNKNYKLALKNLKWYYLHATPNTRPLCQHAEAAFVWFKNNKLTEAENILHVVFFNEPRYKNIFHDTPIKGTVLDDGGFQYLDSIESQIALQRKIFKNPDYIDFVIWGKKRFILKNVIS